MSLAIDLSDLQSHLSNFQNFGQLRTYLAQHNLDLITTIYSDGFSCLDWNVTEGKVSGTLSLKLKISVKLSSLSGDHPSYFESRSLYPIRLEERDWIDQKKLFQKLKQGITQSIEKLHEESKQ